MKRILQKLHPPPTPHVEGFDLASAGKNRIFYALPNKNAFVNQPKMDCSLYIRLILNL